MAKSRDKWQFGDFQTPNDLSRRVIEVLRAKHNVDPDVIIEPTCGKGSFLIAALNAFPKASLIGFDVNPHYIEAARAAIPAQINNSANINLNQSDFFAVDWTQILDRNPGRLLVLGNPPWVTSSELGIINSTNLPAKTNFQGRRGIEAITGSGNFDISEWMLLQHVDWLEHREGTVALLCKYSVARKVMRQVRQKRTNKLFGYVYLIDAKYYFSASVDACLFMLTTERGEADCEVYRDLDADAPAYVIGERDGCVVKDVAAYEKHRILKGQDPAYIWRSGLKHDCSKVMELAVDSGGYRNGLDEYVELEDRYVYPLLKSSDVANGRIETSKRVVLVTQTFVGEDTECIQDNAPNTWHYLQCHASRLNKRRSAIYKDKPRYSIFGVGPYTFGKWKIAISSLYKKLEFQIIGPINDKPVVFDDTVNFLSFSSEEEALFFYQLLSEPSTQTFLESMIFWDEKRPITTAILRRLSLMEIAREIGLLNQYRTFVGALATNEVGQLGLGIAEESSKYVGVVNR